MQGTPADIKSDALPMSSKHHNGARCSWGTTLSEPGRWGIEAAGTFRVSRATGYLQAAGLAPAAAAAANTAAGLEGMFTAFAAHQYLCVIPFLTCE